MKILIISSIFPPHIFGGAEIAAYNLTKALTAQGHEVAVATLQEPEDEPAWGTLTDEGYQLYRLKSHRSHTLYGRTKAGDGGIKKAIWHAQDYFDPRNRSDLKRLIADFQPDHIDIHNIMGIGFNALSTLNNSNATISYTLHDVGLACFHASLFKAGKNCESQCSPCKISSSLRQNEVFKLKRLGFISPTQANIDRVKVFAPKLDDYPQLALHNVPDPLPTLQPKAESEHSQILFVGRLDPVKGIAFLCDVLADLSATHSFKLTVLGTGPQEKMLREKYQSADWVEFKGFVSSNHVAHHISQSDLVCTPSIAAESYGLVTAQALRMGVPVIGSDLGGTAELIRANETGVLVPIDDKSAWRNAFIDLLESPEKLNELAKNTHSYKDEYSDQTIVKNYLEFVSQL